jgi:phospholipase C
VSLASPIKARRSASQIRLCLFAPSDQHQRRDTDHGFYTRADLPFYYAVADAFTICDNYFCSVIGPSDPNRLYTVAASIDPDGKNGGDLPSKNSAS